MQTKHFRVFLAQTEQLIPHQRKQISTKYLESYLSWMRILDRESDLTPQKVLAMSARQFDAIYT